MCQLSNDSLSEMYGAVESAVSSTKGNPCEASSYCQYISAEIWVQSLFDCSYAYFMTLPETIMKMSPHAIGQRNL